MKKRYYWMLLGIIITTIVELSILLPISSLAYSVSLVFIFVCALTFLVSLQEALSWALIQGTVLDLLSPSPFGVYIVSCVILVISIKFMQHTWFKQASLLSVTVITAVSLIVTYTVFFSAHYATMKIGLLIINPVQIVGILQIIFGIVVQCLIVSAAIRLFARNQKFSLL